MQKNQVNDFSKKFINWNNKNFRDILAYFSFVYLLSKTIKEWGAYIGIQGDDSKKKCLY